MKKLLLALAFALGLSPLAFAQQGPIQVPQVGNISNVGNQQLTYTAGFIGLVPAASATDVICLSGSATKTIALTRVQLSGSAGTLVSLPITMVRRAALNTGGTPASTTANPANTIAKHDTLDATATAVPVSYTANPTLTDGSPTYLRSQSLTLPVTSAGTSIAPIDWKFAELQSTGEKMILLRGLAQQICLNLNAVSVSSGVLNGSLSWIEY